MNLEKHPEKQFNMKLMKQLSIEFKLTEPIIKLLFLRDINTKEKISTFLTPSESLIYDPFLLKNMNKVVEKIKLAIANDKRILIFGDYDVDGMSATSILYLYLKEKGTKVNYFLPNRYIDEYGLTKGAIDKIKEEFNPDLIITVDCGITAIEEVEYIKSLGIDVIVTDHHEVPEVTPNCLIINPKAKGQEYPFNELCGAGVALKVVQALDGIYALREYLDIAALATIADIVDLTDENRVIVQLGLQKLQSKTREGLKMLFKELKLGEKDLNSIDIAFKVAPKINASGRMGKAEIGLELLLEKDRKKLGNIIKQLLELNILRQDLCQKVYEEAIEQLKNVNLTNKKVIVLASENWDAGLLGIVAARFVDEFNKPTVLFSIVEDRFKGSARSIPGVDIHKAINCVKVPLESFGGHTMAAGLTVLAEHYENFKLELEKCVDKLFDASYFYPKKYYDLDLKVEEATLEFVKELNYLAPFGHENALPIFNLSFKGAKISPMKNYPEHLTIFFHKLFSIIHFNGASNLLSYAYFKEKNALVELQINSFKNSESVRGIVKGVQFSNINLKEVHSFVKGNYLEQLTYKEPVKKANYNTYQSSEFETIVVKLLQKHSMGNLIVFSSTKTYEIYLELIKRFNLPTYLFEVNDKLGLNACVLGLNSFENLNTFQNIIFADNILCETYINAMQKITDATLYLPKIVYNKAMFHISLEREIFGIYFNAIKFASRQKISSSNSYFYFNHLKNINKQIKNFNYPQFLTCVKVFKELKIIEEVKSPYEYSLKLNKTVQSSLENSLFYQKLK